MKLIRISVIVIGLGALVACGSKQAKNTAPAQTNTQVPAKTNKGDGQSVASKAVDQDGSITDLATIYFEFDSYDLSPQARETLARNAKHLERNRQATILIEGHCDERGTVEYNVALGERRARAAKDYMVRLGVDPSRIDIISYGEERPAVAGSGEDAWAQNRRGQFGVKNRR